MAAGSALNNTMDSQIRTATSDDREDIRQVHLAAFPASENALIAALAVNLLSEKTCPETISLVATIGDSIIGHIAFSPVTIDDGMDWHGYILSPAGVVPGDQQRGIGTALIENGIQLLTRNKVNVLFVYGDPDYYGRFGFSFAAAENYAAPYELKYPFGWQATVLNPGRIRNHAARLSCVPALHQPALW